MLTTGVVSITFRKLTSPEIIHLVRKSGLKYIEWGGDVHVPHGKIAAAEEIRKRTDDAGLSVAAYGSYYRVGKSEKEQSPFEEVLETAVALKAPTLRVWAGTTASEITTGPARARIVRDARRIAKLATEAKVTVSFEFHADTLTDTNESAGRFFEEVAQPNVFSYWQPRAGESVKQNLEGLDLVLPKLTNVHAFSWVKKKEEMVRRALSAGKTGWSQYLEKLRTSERDHCILLEFVSHDDPDAFLADAKTLQEWLA